MTRGRRWLLVALLALPTAWTCAALARSVQHSLASETQLHSSKLDLEMGLMGAVAWVVTPTALAGDRLNLGAWHGFQEIFFVDAIRPSRLSLRLRLVEGGVASVLYNKTTEGFSGFRVSRSQHFETAHFVAAPRGNFLRLEALPVADLGDAWHRLDLRFAEDHVALQIDGGEPLRVDDVPKPSQYLGLRGGTHDAFVDNLEIVAADDGVTYRADFDRGWPSAIEVAAAFVAVFGLLIGLGIAISRLSGGQRDAATYAFAANFSLLILVVPTMLLERFALAPRYDYASLLFEIRSPLDDYRGYYVGTDEILQDLREEWSERPPSAPRVLFVGTSQTWGAGATRREHRFVDRVALALEREGLPVEALVTSLPGKQSAELLKQYRAEWLGWAPDIAVFNLGTNDSDTTRLVNHLETFLELNRERGIASLLVLEPNHAEGGLARLTPNHEAIRRVAADHGVPLVDLHSELLSKKNDGFLWWDFVHLSDFGHELAARVLADALKPILRQREGVDTPP